MGSNLTTPGWAEQVLSVYDDAVAVLTIGTGANGAVQWCTEAFARLLQGTAADVVGMSKFALCTQMVGLAEGLAALAAGQDAHAEWSGPLRMDENGDVPCWHRAHMRRLPRAALASGAGSPAVVLRLSPRAEQTSATRRHLEDRERLLFTSRSLAVGEMATTLAHELNQPLGSLANVLRGVKTRVATLKANPSPAGMSHLEQGVQLALDQVQYAARIIGRVRDFTQSHQPRRELVDLLALLHSSLTLLDWDLARHGVRVSLDVQALSAQGGAPVAGDGVMLQQVLVNLLRNAIDAMADSPPDERRLSVSSQVDDAGEHLEIAIADTGCGIGEDAAGQLFMPFVTTKPTGMGVGLNICRSLIELHQGRLWFTPNEERGCTFHVALPLVPDADAAQLPRFHDFGEACP